MKEKTKGRKISEIFNKNLLLISIILGLLVIFGLKINFIADSNYLGFTNRANDVIYIIFTVGVILLTYYSLKIRDKRLWIVSIIVGIIFSILYYLGDIQNQYINSVVPTSKKFILYSIIKLGVYFLLFTSSIVMLFNKLPLLANKFNTKKEWKFFTNNKKSLIIVALLFFISYIPFFLYYYPGNINTDNIGSLYQITGIKPYSNMQPIFYTLIYGGLWNLGKMIFGTSTAGVATYTVFQMIYTSIVFSVILYYMAKRKIDLKWRIITFLFLILNPINAWFAIRSEKGIIFHLTLILVIIGIIDIIHEREQFFKKKWKPIILGLITIMMIFIRNNGIYTLILTLPFLIIACKNVRLKIVALFGIVIVFTEIVQGPIFKALNINYSSPGEVLSIPMQQFARISKYASDRLSEEDKEIIEKYFPVSTEKLVNEYVPWFADPTKHNFSTEEFEKDKITFIKQYVIFAFKYPVQTISSLVFNTGINYSPNFNAWSMARIYGTETEDAYITCRTSEPHLLDEFNSKYQIEKKKIVNFSFLDKINELVLEGSVPVFSILICNIGFYFWILILCFAYCIYIKKYRNIVMLLPILGLWATAVAAPMVDLRYIYSMFLTAPIFIGVIVKDSKEKN